MSSRTLLHIATQETIVRYTKYSESYPLKTVCGRVIKNNKGKHWITERSAYATCGK